MLLGNCSILSKFHVIYHAGPSVDGVAYDLVLSPRAMAHFVVNDAVVHSLAFVALYDLVELELLFKKEHTN